MVLSDDDTDDKWLVILPRDKHRTTAVAGESGEVSEECGMSFDGEQRRACEYSLAGDGEARAVSFKPLRERKDEERAADMDFCCPEAGFGCEDAGIQRGNAEGETFG